jgi:hypothetical protein
VPDDRGYIQIDVPQGQLLKMRFAAPGYIPNHVEATPQTAGIYRTFDMFPVSHKTTVLTGWTAAAGYAVVQVYSNNAPCESTVGVVVSVKNHPEITVAYATDKSTRSATLTEMDAFGVALVGPMPPGTYEIVAGKQSCAASADLGKFTWPTSTDVEADALSWVWLKLP